jgi:hypothetical protein
MRRRGVYLFLPPLLLFIGSNTGVKRSETPRGWPLGPIDRLHVEA